jgi:hypothetical protein
MNFITWETFIAFVLGVLLSATVKSVAGSLKSKAAGA